MAKLETKMGMSDVFETGNYRVKTITLEKSHTTIPTEELFIVSPLEKGTYPILLFCHGFMLANTWYTTLLKFIASHGYIVIAPKVLKYFSYFNFYFLFLMHVMSIPVAVIGTEYGNQSNGLVPPFAPDGVNHSEFYNESKPPACYFLTREYGHVDMMDDWVVDTLKYVCKSGEGSKDSMRRSVGGIVVAFLRCYLDKVGEDLNAIVDDPTMAPILLDPVIYVKE